MKKKKQQNILKTINNKNFISRSLDNIISYQYKNNLQLQNNLINNENNKVDYFHNSEINSENNYNEEESNLISTDNNDYS